MKAMTRLTMLGRIWLMTLSAVATAFLMNGPYASALDGRDAPTASLYSAIDIGALYMFRDPPCTTTNCSSPNLVMVLTTEPVADLSFGPTYHFQPNAIYRFNFSTTANAIATGTPTASIDFVFSPFANSSTCPAPNPACQTFTATFPDGTIVPGLTTQGSSAAMPNAPVVTEAGPISIFAGPRESPLFFDLVGFNRFIADFNKQTTLPAVPHFNLFTGRDAYLGKNVNAIVVELPISMLLPAGSTKIAAWAVTYLVPDSQNLPAGAIASNGKPFQALQPRQIDRQGNPIVNLSLISEPLRDAFNFGLPQNDASDFAPVIASNLIRYGVDQTNVLPVLATAIIPDTLKFDTTLADGYLQVPPNGRQLQDRTTDFLLTLFFNVQGPPGTQHPGSVTCPNLAQTAFSDCTNPKVFLPVFPFIGPPLQPTP